MCTLTLIPIQTKPPPAYRLAFNRDEKRDRPAGQPPVCRTIGGRGVLMPIDPVSGGTWIAANELGLALALMNRNPQARGDWDSGTADAEVASASRGIIVPQLVPAADIGEVTTRMNEIDLTRFAPFTLFTVDLTGEIGGGATGSKVRISKQAFATTPGSEWLHLAEVEVFAVSLPLLLLDDHSASR